MVLVRVLLGPGGGKRYSMTLEHRGLSVIHEVSDRAQARILALVEADDWSITAVVRRDGEEYQRVLASADGVRVEAISGGFVTTNRWDGSHETEVLPPAPAPAAQATSTSTRPENGLTHNPFGKLYGR